MPSPQAQDAFMRFVFFVVLMLFLSTNNSGSANYSNLPQGPLGSPVTTPRDAFQASLDRQRHALSTLNVSRFGDWKYDAAVNGSVEFTNHGLNLTGFREGDGYSWGTLRNVTDRVKAMRNHVWAFEGQKAVYSNITAQTRGTWVRSLIDNDIERCQESLNLSVVAPHIAWSERKWHRNVTGHEGAMSLVLKEPESGAPTNESQEDLREIVAHLTIEDESHVGAGWEIKLHGVHWPKDGELVLSTTSDKFAGIYALPHLMPSSRHFESSKKLLNKTLSAALQERKDTTFGLPADSYMSDDDVYIPRCEYVVYAQVHPVLISQVYKSPVHKATEDLAAEMQALENELRFPQGAPVIRPPPIQVSLIAFSPDCGFVLESKGPPEYTPTEGTHLQGLKQEVYVRHVKRWCLIWAVVLLIQVALLRQQMRETSTPSTISRISLYTTGILAVADFIVVGVMMLLATSAPVVFPSATLTAFVGCTSMGLGIRLLAEVYRVQEPERAEANRIRDTRLAEELAAFRARRDEYLARHRESQAAIQAAVTQQNAVPVITAVGVEMPGSFPVALTTTSEIPIDAPLLPPPRRIFPTSSPFTENLPESAPDPPIIVPSDQDMDAEITGTLPTTNPTPATPAQIAEASRLSTTQDVVTSYGQFLLFLLIFFFITISSSSWPTILRKIYFHVLALLYFSFWMPQIYRNAVRNCRKAFQWRFVFGQTILRITPWCYFWLKTDNVMGVDQSLMGLSMIVTWSWCQILILIAQDLVGPRFALPKGYLPDAWDYHPLLREDDVEGAGMPLGLIRTPGPGSPTLERRASNASLLGNSKRADSCSMSVDCAICMQILEIPVLSSRLHGGDSTDLTGVAGVAGLLARRLYMITPCRHAFHSKCLEGWMKYRLQCPICRETIPPL